MPSVPRDRFGIVFVLAMLSILMHNFICQVFLDMSPDMRLLIGRQRPVLPLPPTESMQRVRAYCWSRVLATSHDDFCRTVQAINVFLDFMRAVCRRHPVLFVL